MCICGMKENGVEYFLLLSCTLSSFGLNQLMNFGKNFTNLYACSALCNKRVHTIVVCGIVTA